MRNHAWRNFFPHRLLIAAALVQACVFAPMLSGCNRALSPKEFVAAYESDAVVKVEKQGYQFSLLYQSPDYLLAKEILPLPAAPRDWEARRRTLEKHVVLNLHIRPRRLDEAMGVEDGDPLKHGTTGSREELGKQLGKLEKEIGACFRLEDRNGSVIPPLNYRYMPAQGLNGVYSFVFVFPRLDRAPGKSLQGWQIVLKDFGLGIGTVRMEIKTAGHLAIRV